MRMFYLCCDIGVKMKLNILDGFNFIKKLFWKFFCRKCGCMICESKYGI